jgi:phosphoglycolate phosphatase-like HAD superfamily hydrolase
MNTRAELEAFKPTKDFFIGIDSDGTAFDAMNTKHIKAMCPAVLEIWNFQDYRKEFEKIWCRFNLYSGNRGVNRFISLLAAFDQLRKFDAKAPVPDVSALRYFVKNSEILSNAALSAWIEKNPSPLLEDVLRWSERSNELFEEYTYGQRPFAYVEDTLKVMAENADIMLVSSAAVKGLDKDWAFSGLDKYLALFAAQEVGSKKAQLKMAAAGKYSPHKILIIGDAPVDLEAARSINALFFPVVPDNEEESWFFLKNEALPRFFEGKYYGEFENELVGKFLDFLVSIQE